MKQEKIREKQLAEQRDARRVRNAARKEKRVNRKLEQMGLLKRVEKEDKPAAKKEEAAPAKDAGKKGAEKKQGQAKGKDQSSKQAQPKDQPAKEQKKEQKQEQPKQAAKKDEGKKQPPKKGGKQ